MTYDNRKMLIKEILSGITDTMLKKAADMPAHWQGKEIRQYISDMCNMGAYLGKKERKEYNNDIAISGKL